MRPVNAATIKKARPIPYLDAEMRGFPSSKCFVSIGFFQGYWQLPVHKDLETACGIITLHGTFTSNRVLQGITNAARNFQSSIEPLFAELRKHLKAWLDDFNLNIPNEKEHVVVLEKFFQICLSYNLIISGTKSAFFAKSIKWF